MNESSHEYRYLRQRAETLINTQDGRMKLKSLQQIDDMLHELQVRELELQIQNEDLQQAYQELETARNHYLDLYHHAPVGYFTLNEEGIILDVNETGAELLGVSHQTLFDTLFARYVERRDQEQFYYYFKSLIESQSSTGGEIRLVRSDRSRFYAQLQSNVIAGKNGQPSEYRLTISDVTQHRQGNLVSVLLKASQHLTGILDIDLLLNVLVSAVIETLPSAETALLWLYDEQEKKLRVRTSVSQSDDTFYDVKLELDEDIVGLLFTTGQGRIFNDLTQGPVRRLTGNFLLDLMRSAVGVPIIQGSKIIGVLMAYHQLDVGSFGNNDLFLLEALATQISLVLQSSGYVKQISTAHEELRFLTRKVVSAQEDERRRISRELHDEAGQLLALLKMDLQSVRQAMPSDSQALLERLDRSVKLVEETGQHMRELSYLLRPPTLDTLNITDVLQDYCQDFSKRSPLHLNYQTDALPEVEEDSKITLYRFVQEALTNVARHANAKIIDVKLEHKEDWLIVFVKDDGVGFNAQADTNDTQEPKGIGLLGIRERLAALGGRLEILSRPGDGTTLTAYLPLIGEKP